MNAVSPRDPSRTKGKGPVLLETRILDTVKHYSILTVRQLFYVIVSKFSYPSTRKFYKVLDYHLTKMRRANSVLHAKFVDPTRYFIPALRPFEEIELWVEKDSIRNLLENLAQKYRINIQVLRGFGSLSMFRKGLQRATSRGVRKILYIGDFDPSGLLIDHVAEREMSITVQRIALTMEQIRRYQLPSLPVNRRDSRAETYIARYGIRSWDIESVRPRTFLRVVEERLRQNVPETHIVEAKARDRASTVARPVTEQLRRLIEQQVFDLLSQGRSSKDILRQLSLKYELPRGRFQTLNGG
jgi:hypothetical protein